MNRLTGSAHRIELKGLSKRQKEKNKHISSTIILIPESLADFAPKWVATLSQILRCSYFNLLLYWRDHQNDPRIGRRLDCWEVRRKTILSGRKRAKFKTMVQMMVQNKYKRGYDVRNPFYIYIPRRDLGMP
jgi:hypothetical protein